MKGLSVIILAAGAARRMNQAKMLLPFGNATILHTIIEHTKEMVPDNICIVTGFYHSEIISRVQDNQIQFVYNEQWEEGMSGSIKKGLHHLMNKNPKMGSVLILVADQPYITGTLLCKMLEAQNQTNKGIVAASYAGISGTPVLFMSNHFSNLEKLVGDKGARSILQQYPDDLITVDFPLGEMDIDTEDDYKKWVLKYLKC
jgi:molybdenum cofactor cytidylyltransferase